MSKNKYKQTKQLQIQKITEVNIQSSKRKINLNSDLAIASESRRCRRQSETLSTKLIVTAYSGCCGYQQKKLILT
jgi:hypothetical protein